MPAAPLTVLGFGFVLGLRHALDVDHLAAVSTIVSQRRSLWRSSLVGALWGLGHTAALLAAAAVVIGLHTEIPPRVSRGLELGVALMLIGLGLNLLRTLRAGGALHHHVHRHGGRPHVHPHLHGAHEVAPDGHHLRAGRRPFLVGLVHGLAGSGALMLAVLATIPSPALALAYVVIFGAGSIGGMVAMSTLFGVPLALAGGRFARAELGIRLGAALGSLAVGLRLAWQLGTGA
ncbi:MAG: urease accessory protein UreH [Deltaproteobacteria bacterium]|nr:MAG: urease accessory protein UreH [Deltaproteobacteria bacterium]